MEEVTSPQLSFLIAAYAVGAGTLIGIMAKTIRDLGHLRALEEAAGPSHMSDGNG